MQATRAVDDALHFGEDLRHFGINEFVIQVLEHCLVEEDGEIRFHLFLCLAKYFNGFGESRNSVALINGNYRLDRCLFLSKKIHHISLGFSIHATLLANFFD